MFDYSFEEVIQAIDGAKNMNAALKKVLKNERDMPAKSSRFIKEFRLACNAKDPNKKRNYLEDKHQDFAAEILAVTRYAYIEPLNIIAGEITDQYAEKFNSTYEQNGNDINVKDKKAFDQIVSEVKLKIEKGLKDNSLPASEFMKSVLMQHIFDAAVLREILR